MNKLGEEKNPPPTTNHIASNMLRNVFTRYGDEKERLACPDGEMGISKLFVDLVNKSPETMREIFQNRALNSSRKTPCMDNDKTIDNAGHMQ